jgi:hypothetical protein
MRIFYYVLTLLFGLFGLLALLRGIEVVATSGELNIGQLLFGVLGLALAVFFLQRARAS